MDVPFNLPKKKNQVHSLTIPQIIVNCYKGYLGLYSLLVPKFGTVPSLNLGNISTLRYFLLLLYLFFFSFKYTCNKIPVIPINQILIKQ